MYLHVAQLVNAVHEIVCQCVLHHCSFQHLYNQLPTYCLRKQMRTQSVIRGTQKSVTLLSDALTWKQYQPSPVSQRDPASNLKQSCSWPKRRRPLLGQRTSVIVAASSMSITARDDTSSSPVPMATAPDTVAPFLGMRSPNCGYSTWNWCNWSCTSYTCAFTHPAISGSFFSQHVH